ncbi:hypothetical protein TREES_T100002653 [Tupaia chinensis]|uniref:Uncharacterized protein n=1 Tax=Tupaia chinensis TaxID=246437 RepID=L9L568_TUPCH|nr:hypothetical protein TREES_T100002653 [Tupaia chinensis]
MKTITITTTTTIITTIDLLGGRNIPITGPLRTSQCTAFLEKQSPPIPPRPFLELRLEAGLHFVFGPQEVDRVFIVYQENKAVIASPTQIL